MQREEIFERVKEIFEEVFMEDTTISEDTGMDDVVSWDSMSHVSFLVAIEKEYNIKFKMEDLIKLDTIGKILDCVEDLLK